MSDTKLCKFCKSQVAIDAYKCPNCQEWLRPKKKGGAILSASIAVAIAFGVIVGVGAWVKSIKDEAEATRRAKVMQRVNDEKVELDAMFEKVLGNDAAISGGK